MWLAWLREPTCRWAAFTAELCRSILLPHKPGDKVTVVMELDKSTQEIIKQ